MAKFGVLTITYRDGRFIEDCIKQFEGLVDKHLFLVCDAPWHNEKEPMDDTIDILERYGKEFVVSDWDSEAQMRNYGVSQLRNMDWILTVDADERYSEESIILLKDFLETAPLPAYGIGTIYTYWKQPNIRIEPKESGGLIVATKPRVVFTDKRCIDSQWDFLPPEIIMDHLSYVRTDEEMLRKIKTFEHQHEIIPNWYEEKWLKWTPEMENLHPVNPSSFKKAIYVKS